MEGGEHKGLEDGLGVFGGVEKAEEFRKRSNDDGDMLDLGSDYLFSLYILRTVIGSLEDSFFNGANNHYTFIDLVVIARLSFLQLVICFILLTIRLPRLETRVDFLRNDH